jgi:hypothetical protein
MINENACEMFMNDVMEEGCLQKCEINPIFEQKKVKKKQLKNISKNYMLKKI